MDAHRRQGGVHSGSLNVLVDVDGTFEWGWRAGKQVRVDVAALGGSLRSNTVTIR